MSEKTDLHPFVANLRTRQRQFIEKSRAELEQIEADFQQQCGSAGIKSTKHKDKLSRFQQTPLKAFPAQHPIVPPLI